MLSLIESAAQKEDAKVEKKLARKAHVAKILEEKDAKKDAKDEAKKAKLVRKKIYSADGMVFFLVVWFGLFVGKSEASLFRSTEKEEGRG